MCSKCRVHVMNGEINLLQKAMSELDDAVLPHLGRRQRSYLKAKELLGGLILSLVNRAAFVGDYCECKTAAMKAKKATKTKKAAAGRDAPKKAVKAIKAKTMKAKK